jgi:hypothetical protein
MERNSIMKAGKLGLGIIALVVILAAGWFYREPIQQKWQQYTDPELSLQGVQIPPVQPAPVRVASAPRAHVPASAPAPAAAVQQALRTYTVQPGDGLIERFGAENARFVCDLNRELLQGNCNRVYPGQVLKLPNHVEPKGAKVHLAKQAVTAKPKARKPEVKQSRKSQPVETVWSLTEKGEILYRVVGRAPLLNCGKKSVDVINEEAWVALGLSEEDKVYLREHIDHTGPRINAKSQDLVQILPGVRLEQVTFCRKGQAVAVGPMRTAWDADKAVYGERFVLPSGRALVWMRNCFNWITWQPPEKPVEPPPVEELPPVVEPPPQEPPPAEPQVPLKEPEPEAAVIEDDWDLGFFAGGDKDARYAGGEGAYYAKLVYNEWGRYALGVGGSFSLWEGDTPDGYVYGGRTGAFGLAQKFSFSNRRDLGIKFPMIGGLWERGHDASNKYQQRRFTELLCASVSYTDASREKDGKTVLPEWQIWGSYCNALGQSKSHSWEGKALDSSSLPDNQYVLGIGGRVFLSKNLGNEGLAAKLQPFVELGANQTAPNDPSGHAYVGLRTVNKVWGCGAGLHFADIGRTLGATCTYDAGRHYKLHVQEERWNAMITAVEAMGVAVD